MKQILSLALIWPLLLLASCSGHKETSGLQSSFTKSAQLGKLDLYLDDTLLMFSADSWSPVGAHVPPSLGGPTAVPANASPTAGGSTARLTPRAALIRHTRIKAAAADSTTASTVTFAHHHTQSRPILDTMPGSGMLLYITLFLSLLGLGSFFVIVRLYVKGRHP